MDPRAVVLYEVYPQLDAYADDGIARLLGAFARIEEEANDVAQSAFEAYGRAAGEEDMGDLAQSAEEQGIAYYQTLAELKQGVTNLLAIGLYHLFEQHYAAVRQAVTSAGGAMLERPALDVHPKIEELRLLANAVKHADGSAAAQLRKVRPDYFLDPAIRDTPLAERLTRRPMPLINPLGGTDLFVDRADLAAYRDAIRAFWEHCLPQL